MASSGSAAAMSLLPLLAAPNSSSGRPLSLPWLSVGCKCGTAASTRQEKFICRAQTRRSEVYNGLYGPWSIEPADVREVLLYRAGLVTSAATFLAVGSTAFLPEDSQLRSFIATYKDVFFCLGAASLGLSLVLIHIYLTPLKRALQVFWSLGSAASLIIAWRFAYPAEQSLVDFVVENPSFVWFVGPLFASLTGLVFKEGLCYGKLEAAALFLVIPLLVLAHLGTILDETAEKALLATWMLLFTVFAARKFTQPIKDDIGDKSIFMFNALPKEEREAILRSKQRQ